MSRFVTETRSASSPPRSRRRRTAAPACEALETRAMLSATPELVRLGAIDQPGGVGTVELPVTPDRFTPSARGWTLFEIEVKAADGSALDPGLFRVVSGSGRAVATATARGDGSLARVVALRPGEYGVRVRGAGDSTGPFVVQARLVGDTDDNRRIEQADVSRIRSALGARPGDPRYDAALDADRSGRVGAADLALGRLNLGADTQQLHFTVTNTTHGKYANDQIYFAIIGLNSSNQWCWLQKDGTLKPMTPADNGTPGRFFHKLSDVAPAGSASGSIDVPKSLHIDSGRVWLSVGKPLDIKVDPRTNSPVQPNWDNPADPNNAITWDHVEFSLLNGVLGGNTTQVDQFGFPMTLAVTTQGRGGARSAVSTVGITASRDDIFAKFKAAVPPDLANAMLTQAPQRILAPKHAFFQQRTTWDYFNAAIQTLWSTYVNTPLTVRTDFGAFVGKVDAATGEFVFTQGATTYRFRRPTSWEAVGNSGPLASGDAKQQAIGKQLAAALNRAVAQLPYGQWGDVPRFYAAPNVAKNSYAQFWHTVSIGGKAYGFDYDDVFDQSDYVSSNDPLNFAVTVIW